MRKTMGVWRESIRHVAAGASDTFYSEPVPPGEQWYLQRVTVQNENFDTSCILVSIEAGTRVYPLYYWSGVPSLYPDHQAIECWLMETERLRFDVTLATTGDVLHAWVIGHKHGVGQP